MTKQKNVTFSIGLIALSAFRIMLCIHENAFYDIKKIESLAYI